MASPAPRARIADDEPRIEPRRSGGSDETIFLGCEVGLKRIPVIIHLGQNGVRSWQSFSTQFTANSSGAPYPACASSQLARMRDEFASYGFLTVAITGFVLLCSGVLAFIFG
jgi:hypothetical protein